MRKIFLIAFIFMAFIGCEESKYKHEVKPHDNSYLGNGVYVRKVTMDSIDYVVVTNYQSGIAIIRHSK
jgi:hypothetical protein